MMPMTVRSSTMEKAAEVASCELPVASKMRTRRFDGRFFAGN